MIILGFGSYINNPMLFPFRIFFTIFYGSHYGLPILQHTLYILPLALLILYFLFIFILIYKSFENSKYTNILLIVIILSSTILSIDLYNTEIICSNGTKDNPISAFLNTNTNEQTLYIIDNYDDKTFLIPNIRASICDFGFWNKGRVIIIDAENTTLYDMYGYETAFLISTKLLPYKEVESSGKYKLYNML
jgi:hypothetical protein